MARSVDRRTAPIGDFLFKKAQGDENAVAVLEGVEGDGIDPGLGDHGRVASLELDPVTRTARAGHGGLELLRTVIKVMNQ